MDVIVLVGEAMMMPVMGRPPEHAFWAEVMAMNAITN